MKTQKQIQQIAKDILADASEYPADVRDEVLDELINVWLLDEDLSAGEKSQLIIAVSARR
jgi:hypothetical protein